MLILRTSNDRIRRAYFYIHPMSADLLWIIGVEKDVLTIIRNIIRLHAPAADEVKEGWFRVDGVVVRTL